MVHHFFLQPLFGFSDHFVVVENEGGDFVEGKPPGLVFELQLRAVILDVNEGEISYGDDASGRIPVDITETAQLFHVYVVHARELVEDTHGRFLRALLLSDKSTHQRPLTLLGLKAPLDEQGLQLIAIESENNA